MIACFPLLGACNQNSATLPVKQTKAGVMPEAQKMKKIAYPALDSLKEIQIGGHWVSVVSPRSVKGNIVVLPGWNFPRQDWCQQSSLCREALHRGYRLILPEMGKSVYSERFFPETRSDWKVFPNRAWLIEQMIPFLQDSLGVLSPAQSNYILGLSTGGRGVALLLLARPTLWKAGAALSGDFDQTQMPQDRLMIGYYGPMAQFPERWQGADNPTRQAHLFKTPIYLGHGRQDKVVPVSQTEIFYQALKKAQPGLRVKLHLTDAQHDYAYWNSEVKNMLDFFAEFE